MCKQGCGKAARPGRRLCEQCAIKQAEAMEYAFQMRKNQGICIHCGDRPSTGKVHCEICYLKKTSYSHFKNKRHSDMLKSIFENQGGMCPYTGKNLRLGYDTSLDHIIPLCAGGSNDPSNLQWVYEPVNNMKNKLSEAKFLALVALIQQHKATRQSEQAGITSPLDL